MTQTNCAFWTRHKQPATSFQNFTQMCALLSPNKHGLISRKKKLLKRSSWQPHENRVTQESQNSRSRSTVGNAINIECIQKYLHILRDGGPVFYTCPVNILWIYEWKAPFNWIVVSILCKFFCVFFASNCQCISGTLLIALRLLQCHLFSCIILIGWPHFLVSMFHIVFEDKVPIGQLHGLKPRWVCFVDSDNQ